ncbi:DNA adenine methylase [Flectobacillus roseus]
MSNIQLKTPINYYGGKQQLLSKLLPLIPEHEVYTEAFFGGGALFFAKEVSAVEAINDVNKQVINFYRVAKKQFESLKDEIDCTLFAEQQYQEAKAIYKDPEMKETDVLRAWSLFVLSHQAFLSKLTNSWKFSHERNLAKTFQTKKEMFDYRYVKRLESTQIFCRDANRMILNMDCPEAFHFVDPPYINTDCGHYSGYTETDYETLLETLSTVEGKFLLTSFPSDILAKYTERNKWSQIEIRMASSAKNGAKKTGEDAKKTEVITTNYPFSEAQLSLFQ